MRRSIRIVGKFVWLGLVSGALTLPLAAEEVTVTVPPDSPPAQSAPEPAASPSLPTFSSGDSAEKPVADSGDAAAPASPAAPVKHKTKKKAAAAAPPADDAAGPAPEAAASAPPAAKPKTAKASPCLNVDENTCGGNSACIWVAAGTNDAGKATKARCRSLAILKREAAKKAKAEKTGSSEVLPWAAKGATTTSSTTSGTATAAAEAPKPKKTKTASAKKVAKPKPEPAAAAAPTATDSAPAGDAQSSGGGAD